MSYARPLSPMRSVMPTTGPTRGLADSLHARSVRAVRRLRRPPARPRQPGAGRRPGPPARPGRHRRAGRAHRDLADGHAGLAGAGAAAAAAAATAPPTARSGGSTRPATGSTAAPTQTWDGHWHLAFVDPPADRAARDPAARRPRLRRVRRAAPTACGSARSRARELDEVLRAGRRDGPRGRAPTDSTRAPVDAWDLDALARGVRTPALDDADDLLAAPSSADDDPDEAAFAARFHLVHEWRKFLFTDPGCPTSCCRRDWPGRAAAELFTERGRRGSSPARRPLRRPLPRLSACTTGVDRDRLPAMTDSEPVLLDLTDGVATITLNRPDAMNSLDVATKEALLEAVRTVAEDPAVRCVVLTGTGRAFCVGQDLKEHIELLQSGVERRAVQHRRRALQPDRHRAGDDAQAGHRRRQRRRRRAPAPAWRSPATCGSSPTPAGFNLAFAGVALSCDTGAQLPPAAAGRPGQGDRAALLPAHRLGRGGPRARAGHPGRAGRRAAGRRSPSSPAGWRPARPWRSARCAGRSRTPPATPSRRRWRSRAR